MMVDISNLWHKLTLEFIIKDYIITALEENMLNWFGLKNENKLWINKIRKINNKINQQKLYSLWWRYDSF
jgi:hypothetical protein